MLRIYLLGRVLLRNGASAVDETALASRQARLLLVFLVAERHRAVPSSELADLLWAEATPASWENSLKSLMSKIRTVAGPLVHQAGLSESENFISHQFGCYQIHPPDRCWVDWEAARKAIDEAGGLIRAGEMRRAWAPTNIGLTIASRAFLPGDTSDWAARRRTDIARLRLRASECYCQVCLAIGQAELAERVARRALRVEPYHETSYRTLMRVHAASGNRAEALQVYHDCRRLLRDDLGVEPSAQTQELFEALLRRP